MCSLAKPGGQPGVRSAPLRSYKVTLHCWASQRVQWPPHSLQCARRALGARTPQGCFWRARSAAIVPTKDNRGATSCTQNALVYMRQSTPARAQTARKGEACEQASMGAAAHLPICDQHFQFIPVRLGLALVACRLLNGPAHCCGRLHCGSAAQSYRATFKTV